MNDVLGARIKHLRNTKGLSQEEMAERLGFSRQRLGRIESGEADISYDAICRIADVLCINPSEITEATEEMKSLAMLFRTDKEKALNDECEKLFDMIDVIYAHKAIYLRTARDQ